MKDKYLLGEKSSRLADEKKAREKADKHIARRADGRRRKLDLFSINRGQEVADGRTWMSEPRFPRCTVRPRYQIAVSRE